MSTQGIFILFIAFSIFRIILPVFITLYIGELINRSEIYAGIS